MKYHLVTYAVKYFKNDYWSFQNEVTKKDIADWILEMLEIQNSDRHYDYMFLSSMEINKEQFDKLDDVVG